MGTGAYRHHVTLEHPAVVLDPATWDCSLQSAATQVIDGLSAFYVRGRYHPGITLETQINFEGRTFQVQSVTDLDERHVELQLMCVEVVGRGTTPGGTPIVNAPPTLTTPPVGASIVSGGSVTLTVVAAGTPPLAYQWTAAGADIAGATNAFYVTGPLTTTSTYAVRVSNAYGSVTSTPVTVTVVAIESPLLTALISYWTLDEASGTRADSHGRNHLTPTNAPGSAPGKIGAACDFESTSTQYLSHFDPTPLGDEDFTYALWLKAESNNQYGALLSTDNSHTLRDNGAGHLVFFLGDGTHGNVTAPAVTDTNWHFVVIWYDAAAKTIHMQLDGAAALAAATLIPMPVQLGPRQIGRGFGTYFDGLIDEVGLWRRLLTADERTQLYNAGHGLTYPFGLAEMLRSRG